MSVVYLVPAPHQFQQHHHRRSHPALFGPSATHHIYNTEAPILESYRPTYPHHPSHWGQPALASLAALEALERQNELEKQRQRHLLLALERQSDAIHQQHQQERALARARAARAAYVENSVREQHKTQQQAARRAYDEWTFLQFVQGAELEQNPRACRAQCQPRHEVPASQSKGKAKETSPTSAEPASRDRAEPKGGKAQKSVLDEILEDMLSVAFSQLLDFDQDTAEKARDKGNSANSSSVVSGESSTDHVQASPSHSALPTVVESDSESEGDLGYTVEDPASVEDPNEPETHKDRSQSGSSSPAPATHSPPHPSVSDEEDEGEDVVFV